MVQRRIFAFRVSPHKISINCEGKLGTITEVKPAEIVEASHGPQSHRINTGQVPLSADGVHWKHDIYFVVLSKMHNVI